MTSSLCTLDLARMRRERVDKLRAAMSAAGVDTLVLCNEANVSYATGARSPASDHVRASWWRAIAARWLANCAGSSAGRRPFTILG